MNENVDTQLDLVDTGAVAGLFCVLQTSDAMIRSAKYSTMSVLEVRNANKHKIPIRFASVRVRTDAAQPAVVNLCDLGALRPIVTILQTATTFVRFSRLFRKDSHRATSFRVTCLPPQSTRQRPRAAQ